MTHVASSGGEGILDILIPATPACEYCEFMAMVGPAPFRPGFCSNQGGFLQVLGCPNFEVSRYVVTIKCNKCRCKVQGLMSGEQVVTQTAPMNMHND